MVKYGFNVWIDEEGSVRVGDDVIEEISAFMSGLGIFFENDFNDLSSEFYYERIYRFYKDFENKPRASKKSFNKWVSNFIPYDINESAENISQQIWMDTIANIYLFINGVEFPEEVDNILEKKMS